jgi:hypothetical protein
MKNLKQILNLIRHFYYLKILIKYIHQQIKQLISFHMIITVPLRFSNRQFTEFVTRVSYRQAALLVTMPPVMESLQYRLRNHDVLVTLWFPVEAPVKAQATEQVSIAVTPSG